MTLWSMPESSVMAALRDSFQVVQCREADISAVASVHLATRRAAYADVLPASVLEMMSTNSLRKGWEARLCSAPNPHALLVGITGPQQRDVAGFGHAGPGGESGI